MLNMEKNHLILNGMNFNSNIIEEFIGLKLPDYQFMKYIKSFVDSKDVTQHTCMNYISIHRPSIYIFLDNRTIYFSKQLP